MGLDPQSSDKGETQIRIEIDPSDQLEELYEDNNILEVTIGVSALESRPRRTVPGRPSRTHQTQLPGGRSR